MVTLLVNGDLEEAEASAAAGFKVVVATGSGRSADALAAPSSREGAGRDAAAVPFVGVPFDDPIALLAALSPD